jgi:hypothetical protein
VTISQMRAESPERRIDLAVGVPQDIAGGPDRPPWHPRRQFVSLRTQLCRRLAQALKAQRSTASRIRLSASNATRSMPST